MNNTKKEVLINGLFFCSDVYVLFDCKEANVCKEKVGDWLPKVDGFEFKTTVFRYENGQCYLPVFTKRENIPRHLKAGRFIAKRSITQAMNEAKKINATLSPQQAA